MFEWLNILVLIFVACQYVLPIFNVQLLSPNQNTEDNRGYIPYHPRQVQTIPNFERECNNLQFMFMYIPT
jgi:hypothetical protein